jgi:hypothetical protein
MSRIKYLSMVALAVTTVAAPAMAREKVVARQAAQSVVAGAPDAGFDGRACAVAPRVGAFASDPWTNGNVPCEP